jgi:hypothetical protein
VIERTQVKVEKAGFELEHPSSLMTIGSCFSDEIGKKMEEMEFDILVNPFGTLFNPLSIANSLRFGLSGEIREGHILEHDGVWKSLDHHSRFISNRRETLIARIRETQSLVSERIRSAEMLFISLGTSIVYELKKTEEVVANCHKIPAAEFTKFMMTSKEIHSSLEGLLEILRETNPKLQVVFTLSPVRHLKDGAVANQLSKSRMLEVVHALLDSNTHYFPAYEILLDELRDYRYYARDLVHPSELAVDYIWQRFREYALSDACNGLVDEIDTIYKRLKHRPQHSSSHSHQKFEEQTTEMVKSLKLNHPQLKLSLP